MVPGALTCGLCIWLDGWVVTGNISKMRVGEIQAKATYSLMTALDANLCHILGVKSESQGCPNSRWGLRKGVNIGLGWRQNLLKTTSQLECLAFPCPSLPSSHVPSFPLSPFYAVGIFQLTACLLYINTYVRGICVCVCVFNNLKFLDWNIRLASLIAGWCLYMDSLERATSHLLQLKYVMTL